MSTEIVKAGDGSSVAEMSTSSEMVVSRQAQEVQAAMIVAKRFPRNEMQSIERIKQSCKRPALAEVACYQYSKGGTKIAGASIRLAEAMASAWGNLDYGILELEQNTDKHESLVMAYCWDLETNTRQTKVFTVSHTRHTKKGDYTLTDPREIYETTANQGARRMRACILGIIPGDVQDVAVSECEKTLIGNNTQPIRERIEKMLVSFEEYNVGNEDIETLLQHNIESCNERDIVKLGKIYNSLKDGMGKKEDFFKPATETIKQPKPKTKEKAEKKTEPATPQGNDALIVEIVDIEAQVGAEKVQEVRAMARVGTEEPLELMPDDKLKELLQLYKV